MEEMRQNLAYVLDKWKDSMRDIIKLRFGDDEKYDKSKVEEYLDNILAEHVQNKQCVLLNNYKNKIVQTDILSLTDLIAHNKIIVSGKAALYLQQELSVNPFRYYIDAKMTERKSLKKQLYSFSKESFDYQFFDIKQSSVKKRINSLYGASGYPGFVFYNRFNAESTTAMGKRIVTTGMMGFENFLGDNGHFNTVDEMYTYIDNIYLEYKELKDEIDVSKLPIEEPTTEIVVDRLLRKVRFNLTDEIKRSVYLLVDKKKSLMKMMLFFKNNLYAFSQLPFIVDNMRHIVENLGDSDTWNIPKAKDDSIVEAFEDIWKFYKIFVLYSKPIFDRVRKAVYNNSKAIIYADTDSNFVSLYKPIKFIKTVVIPARNQEEIVNIGASFWISILDRVVAANLKDMCKGSNITDEYAIRLGMKNEFFNSRMVFTKVKKRYLANAKFQEGVELNNGIGVAEIKGFDFKKAGVKAEVRDIFTTICLDDILRAEVIDLPKIFRKMLNLKENIITDLRSGGNKFIRQLTVQNLSNYKNPYSTYAVMGLLLWNTLMPEYAIETPADVDVVPIKSLTFKNPKAVVDRTDKQSFYSLEGAKNPTIREFADKFPEEYNLIRLNFYENFNPLIQHATLSYLCKPRDTSEITLPEWYSWLVNTDKIVNDTLSMMYSILEVLGLITSKISSLEKRMTNLISI
jgi:hypothetical protein